MRRGLASVLACLLLLGGVAGLVGETSTAASGTGSPLGVVVRPALTTAPARTAVLILENRSYRQVIGNPSAPYLNGLARRYALATRYYALGHPSLPNYLALTTGSTWGVTRNCRTCRFDHTSLFGQFDRAKVSWRAYFQTLPARKLAVVHTATYNVNYNPLAYLSDVRQSAADRARLSGFTRLNADLRAHRLPRFSWVAPDIAHDGHTSTLRATDRYAARLVPRLLSALGPHGLLYVTWDEGLRRDRTGPGGGHVVLIAAGPRAQPHARLSTTANHYALLRTIERSYGLRALRGAARASTPTLVSTSPRSASSTSAIRLSFGPTPGS